MLVAPWTRKEGWTAAAQVDSPGGKGNSADVAAMRAELAELKAILAMTGVAAFVVDAEKAKHKMEELEKSIAKVSNNAGNASVSAAKLNWDLQVYLEENEARVKVATNAAAKQTEAYNQLQEAQQSEVDCWIAQKEKTATEEVQRLEKWETRRKENAARHDAVIQEHQERIAAAPAQANDQAAAKTDSARVDLNRVVTAKLEDLPALTSQPNDTYLEELASLHFFYCNVGDFGRVPPTTFAGMEVAPGVIHTMVGDRIWEGFWEKENSKSIAKTQYIPTMMHEMLRHVLRPKREQLATMAGMEPARVRYEASKTLADRVELGYVAY
jgi:chemotaxis protein histidine kinase CheA